MRELGAALMLTSAIVSICLLLALVLPSAGAIVALKVAFAGFWTIVLTFLWGVHTVQE